MKVKDLIKHLESTYDPDDHIAYDIWTIDDVIEHAFNHYSERQWVTEESAINVIESMDNRKDASIGLNWDVLDAHLEQELAERG